MAPIIIPRKHTMPPKKTGEKSKKAGSPYNAFMKVELARLKKADPKLAHKDAFKQAAGNWTAAKAKK